jgi:hypothetical protein
MISQAYPLSSPGLAIIPGALPIDGGARQLPDAVSTDRPHLPLAEVVDHEARGYRAWGTPTGDFLARQMERLAQLIRWTGAVTPEDHEARMEVWDEEIREQWFDRGYYEGSEAGRRDACRAARTD